MDVGRDIADPEARAELSHTSKGHSKDAHDYASQLHKDFGIVETGDDLDDDPIVPGRKRMLFLASACILGNELCERCAHPVGVCWERVCSTFRDCTHPCPLVLCCVVPSAWPTMGYRPTWVSFTNSVMLAQHNPAP